MKIYLFVLDGKPGYRCSVEEAQAVLEDHLRDRRDVSDVWWDDENPYEARVYMYGSSHSDYGLDPEDPYKDLNFETTDQIIWPVTIPEDECKPVQRNPFGGAELTLTVRVDGRCDQIIRSIPETDWNESRIPRSFLLLNFAAEAGQAMVDHWKSKERT